MNDAAIVESKKALKWIIRSGALTTSIIALITLLEGFSRGEIDFRLFIFGVFIILLNGVNNIVLYYQHETSK